MNRHPKIQPQHLERLAYVYIRQSTLYQVGKNLESQDLQYQLTHRAQVLGWTADQVVLSSSYLSSSAFSSRRSSSTLHQWVGNSTCFHCYPLESQAIAP